MCVCIYLYLYVISASTSIHRDIMEDMLSPGSRDPKQEYTQGFHVSGSSMAMACFIIDKQCSL